MMPQPHPDIEVYRGYLLAKLRQCYQELCQSRESQYFEIIGIVIFMLIFFF